ncbi:T9SS type A sorting domain-containing protein [Flavobacterium sp.]|uniref:DUF7619 domain-containing protein n=1 Tax=Flavobacterium sp. TaxID=239 RepID=UPI0012247A23|nr:T9SS type A sorting domain-containing protein [Flavobacterium sp.]RZJ69973.1 MAG: T9SS type A sorting domain-containing protein [Flavobacterium sp.]
MKKLYFLILLCCGWVHAQPDINANPSPLVQCDTDADGIGTFDLTSAIPAILNGINPGDVAVSFHLSLSDAQNNLSEITQTTNYSNTNQTIFVRVEALSDATYSVANLSIVVSSVPSAIIVEPSQNICQGNLATLTFQGNGGSIPYIFSYQINGGTIQTVVSASGVATINFPTSQLATYNVQLVGISGANGCSAALNASSVVTVVAPAIAFPASNIVVEAIPNTGVATFDITSNESTLIGSQTNVEAAYYISESDAISQTEAIVSPTTFVNTQNPQQIWAVVSSTLSNCNDMTSFSLVVSDPGIVFIPDMAFKSALIAEGVDTNSDTEIQFTEAAAITTLNVDYQNINDLTGIKAFTNLLSLYAVGNSLSTLDLSDMPELRLAYLSGNELTSINVNGVSTLQDLVLDQNQLTYLNLSNKPNLDRFSAIYNDLTGITLSNLPLLREINVFGNDLVSLEVASFPNLQILTCASNLLTSLDVTTLSLLKTLDCSNNAISAVNVSGLANLETLYFNDNPVSSHSWTGLSSLKFLKFGNTNINAFDLPVSATLETLECRQNGIATLDLSGFPALTNIDCRLNAIQTLDVSGQTELQLLNCSNNQLETLDLSANTALQAVAIFGNAMQTLFAKNGVNEQFSTGDFTDNAFSYICADETQVASIQTLVGSGTQVNSYCTFVPGGQYDTIMGSVSFDAEGNGCDASDLIGPLVKIRMNDGSQAVDVFTDHTSVYKFYVGTGNYTINPVFENNYFATAPPNADVAILSVNGAVSNNDFCLSANGISPDAEIAIVPIVSARPGNDAVYQVVVRNKGNQILSQTSGVSFSYDESIMDLVSATTAPSSTGSGYLTWNYSDLRPFETRVFTVTLSVNSPTDTPAVNIGDAISFSANVNAAADVVPVDNDFVLAQTVVSDYDPNNKECLQGDVVSVTQIGEYLHYVINFENTGTAPAENIVVKDVLDPTMFDRSSLQILSSSHNVEAKSSTDGILFVFKAIALDSGGHGNILLRVRSLGNLHEGSVVSNKADIFFDYGAPITTNTYHTTFENLSINDPKDGLDVQLYPNPVKDSFTVTSSANINSLEIFDVRGRLLQVQTVGNLTSKFEMATRAAGVYFVRINTEKGSRTEKIIKQ